MENYFVETLYRGKRLSDGKWILGYLVGKKYKYRYFIVYHPQKDDEVKYEAVDIETVGRNTEIFYGNGNPIYEGDVAKNILTGEIGIIKYRHGCFSFETKNGAGQILYFLQNFGRAENLECLGNIYDNKEILKQENNGFSRSFFLHSQIPMVVKNKI